MSVDVRYFTNGEKSAFTVLHTDTGEVEEYQSREDIPNDVRHLFRRFETPEMIGPDLAIILGLKDVFYPDWPKICSKPRYAGHRCVGESCSFTSNENGWKRCRFIRSKEETI